MTASDLPRSRPRAPDALETAAWRAPAADRFDGRPANDWLTRAQAYVETTTAPTEVPDIPRWVIVVAGGLVAAILGALLGGALAV